MKRLILVLGCLLASPALAGTFNYHSQPNKANPVPSDVIGIEDSQNSWNAANVTSLGGQ